MAAKAKKAAPKKKAPAKVKDEETDKAVKTEDYTISISEPREDSSE